MKKLLIISTLLLTVFLSSCSIGNAEIYDDFKLKQASDYSDVENFNNKYIIFYYDSTSKTSNDIADEVLSFLSTNELLDFYLVDVNSVDGVTRLSELTFTPSIVIMSDSKIYELYSGKNEVLEFIDVYDNVELDYDTFEDQHITTYEEALEVTNNGYILYYYLESCPHCIAAKERFLSWAFTKNVEDIYFMNGADVTSQGPLPTELIVLNSGTPTIVVMSNGMFDDEFYTGTEEVFEYIDRIGNGDISGSYEIPDLDYDDFDDIHLDTYNDAKTITNDLHIEYFYSPTCSYCNIVKEDILDMFYILDEVPFYFLDASQISSGTRPDEYAGTPTIFILKDGEILEQFRGLYQVQDFIEDYNAGLIDFTEFE